MKKNLLVSSLIAPAIVFANPPITKLELEKQGFPVADGSIQVKPLIKISNGITTPYKNKILIAHEAIKKNGFYEIDNQEVKTIFKLANQKPMPVGYSNYQDTHLKSTIKDVGLAFEYKSIPVNDKDIIGYAAIGGYDNGWNGITQIFKDSDLGTCQYDLYNIKLSHGSEFIPEELASYDVNGKATLIDVRGSLKSGFVYNIHWADNTKVNDLYCANMIFEKSKTKKLIELAKKIDKSVIIK